MTPVDIRYYYEHLLAYLQRFAHISREDFKLLIPYLEVRAFEKRTVILKAGEVENYVNVVMRGMVYKYVTAGRSDNTLQLATEGHIIQSEISFNNRTPSEVTVESIEPAILVSMHYDNVQKVLKEIPWAENLALAIVTAMYIKKDARRMEQLMHNTKDRFLDYIDKNPHMLQRVPQRILATYLFVKPETFSRLKHLLRTK